MSEWLGVNEVVVNIVVGFLCLLLGLGVSRWRSATRQKALVATHEAEVQAVQQALTELRQKEAAAQTTLHTAQQQLTQQAAQLVTQEERLTAAQEAISHARDAQAQLPIRTQELLAAQSAQQTLAEQCRQLQTDIDALQSAVNEKARTLEQAHQERNALHEQIAQLTADASSRRAALASVQAAHEQEVALRQRITAEIATLYQRLQNGTLAHTTGGAQSGGASENQPAMAAVTVVTVPTPDQRAVIQIDGDEQGSKPTVVAVEQQTSQIEQFLVERGITIKHIPAEAAFDPVLNSLASYLGTHYETVKPLYQQIKRNMQQGDDFTLMLKDEPSEVISRICQFGKKLYDVAFLEQYRYLRSPHCLLKAKTTRLPTAQNFFSGQWLERYIVQQVQAAVGTIRAQTDQSIDFNYITNPQILLPNGQDGELDLIFHVNDAIYWIETKSGDYQQHISKYSMLAKTLNLDANHALMVLTDIPTSRSAELTALFRMGVCSLSAFDNGLMATLQEELQ